MRVDVKSAKRILYKMTERADMEVLDEIRRENYFRMRIVMTLLLLTRLEEVRKTS